MTLKDGIVQFGRALAERNIEIVSTGGTARVLADGGVPVRPLEELTGWPEMLDGRVKTLHPKVHAGILARRSSVEHQAQMAEHDLGYIDLVVVNLYDFAGGLDRGLGPDEMIEQIDIGGPTLLRAAAKNAADVIVVVDPADYPEIITRLDEGRLDDSFRNALAAKVFMHTASYDARIATWMQAGRAPEFFPEKLTVVFERVDVLRYGENPHQQAALYRNDLRAPASLAAAEQLQGKALSYNNLLDLEAALGVAQDLTLLPAEGGAVYVKHNNPCGVAVGSGVADVIRMARECDALSAFGAVVAVNQPVDGPAADVLAETFVEAVIAPGFDAAARKRLGAKKNLRVLELSHPDVWKPRVEAHEFRSLGGGVLVQSRDASPTFLDEARSARVVTERAPTDEEWSGLCFAWTVAKHVRSNAIVFTQADRVVAIGAGQMSRVDSVRIGRLKAGERLQGTVVASDAFFPFRDGVDVLAEAGARAIIQPGGSIRDEEVVQAANEHGIAMLFTGVRHFRH